MTEALAQHICVHLSEPYITVVEQLERHPVTQLPSFPSPHCCTRLSTGAAEYTSVSESTAPLRCTSLSRTTGCHKGAAVTLASWECLISGTSSVVSLTAASTKKQTPHVDMVCMHLQAYNLASATTWSEQWLFDSHQLHSVQLTWLTLNTFVRPQHRAVHSNLMLVSGIHAAHLFQRLPRLRPE